MAYDILKVYGNSDINYVMCSTLELTDDDIESLKQNKLSAPIWGGDTIMLASFHEDTNASSYTISNNIVGYKIQRYETDYNKLYEVATLGEKQLYFEDYNIRNNKSYQYRIVPIYSKDGIEIFGSPLSTDTVYTDWCGWSVIGTKPTRDKNKYVVDYDNIWNFGCNVNPEPIHPTYNKTYLTGFGKFPKVVQGQENYVESGLSCLIGDIKCENYVGDTIDTLEKWRAFCNNGELKLIKDLKGHIFPCSISDTTYTTDYTVLEQITTISFNFTQITDRAEISVYGLGA